MATAKKIVKKTAKTAKPVSSADSVKAKRATKAAPAGDAKLELAVYDASGKQVSTMALPAELFGAPWRADLVHQVVTAYQAGGRFWR